MDALERVIRPIVEGQLLGFIKEHPGILRSVDWYRGRDQDRTRDFIGSISKRIIRDLVCPTVRARLAAALLEPGPDASSEADRGMAAGIGGGARGTCTVRAAPFFQESQ